MHKKTDDFFEEAKNNYDNGVIDVEYSESEIYDEGQEYDTGSKSI